METEKRFRQTYSHTDRQTNRKYKTLGDRRKTDRKKQTYNIDIKRQIGDKSNRQTKKHMETDRGNDRQTDTQKNIGRQTEDMTDKQTDKKNIRRQTEEMTD